MKGGSRGEVAAKTTVLEIIEERGQAHGPCVGLQPLQVQSGFPHSTSRKEKCF